MFCIKSETINLIANFASILTALIACIFYFITVKRNYYLKDIPGTYKIFSGLKGKTNASALFEIKITYVSKWGWFFGELKYGEPFEPNGTGSGGSANVFGKVNYNYLRVVLGWFLRFIKFRRYNPLDIKNISSFHGKLYFLSRNDLDLSTRNWREMIVQEYEIIHYRDAHRFKIWRPKRSESYLQLNDELTLVNVDKIPDSMFDFKL